MKRGREKGKPRPSVSDLAAWKRENPRPTTWAGMSARWPQAQNAYAGAGRDEFKNAAHGATEEPTARPVPAGAGGMGKGEGGEG